jgi:hypothetical protein
MLESLLDNQQQTGRRRLGKLNDKLYADWTTFLSCATEKIQVGPILSPSYDHLQTLERRLSALHVLRCLLGPCVESLVIWDRYLWAKEIVNDGLKVELVNLFDQNQGSGRNTAIVLKPK